ncbi:MAG TPA: isochorismatase family cysteine hydrolase [Bryobacteraceae bacterium]
MVDFAVVPERTALINVDMQNCFVEGYPSSAPDGLAVLDRINRLAAACRDAGILIIHTSHVLRQDGSNIGVLGEINPMVKGIITKGSEPAALHKRLVVDARDILLDKPRFGAFQSTDLELILRSRGIDTVIISGIATSVCCETTAREATVRDFHVFFLSDGTATAEMPGASAAELQKATLATLGFLFAQVLTVDEMMQKVRHAVRTAAV